MDEVYCFVKNVSTFAHRKLFRYSFIEMHLKNSLYIFLGSLFLTVLSSCLSDSDYEYVQYPSMDAQITSFSLSHESFPVLAETKFSIDQVMGTVYNHDSLPFLTKLPQKAIVTYVNGVSGDGNLRILDSLWVKSGDSLDISKVSQFQVFAVDDANRIKTYRLNINIHQIDPDSMQYALFAPNQSFLSSGDNKTVNFNNAYFSYVKDAVGVSAYQSTDMATWGKVVLSGLPENIIVREIKSFESGLCAFSETGELYISTDGLAWSLKGTEYPVKSVLGYMPASTIQKEGLALIVDKEDKLVSSFIPNIFSVNMVASSEYGEVIPPNFPLSAFSVINNQSVKLNRITLVNGISSSEENLNTVWTTEDGIYWTLLSKNQGKLPIVKGGNAFAYNDKIYFIGGFITDDNKTPNESVYSSKDGGMTWQQELSKTEFPDAYGQRSDASLIVDSEGIYFYIIGGMKEDGLSAWTDVWKAALNSQTFIK